MKKIIFYLFFFPIALLFFYGDIASAMTIYGSGFGNSSVNQTWTDNGASQCGQNTWTNTSANLVLSLDSGANGAGYTGVDCDTNWRIKPNLNSSTNYYYKAGDWIGTYTLSSGTAPAGVMSSTSPTTSAGATSTIEQTQTNIFYTIIIFYISLLLVLLITKKI